MNDYAYRVRALNDAEKLAELLLQEVKKRATYVGTVESRKCLAELWRYENLTLLVPVKGPCRRWKIFRGEKRVMADYDIPTLAQFLYMMTGDTTYYMMRLAYLRGYQDGVRDTY